MVDKCFFLATEGVCEAAPDAEDTLPNELMELAQISLYSLV